MVNNNLNRLPAELKELQQWINYQLIDNPDKPDKPKKEPRIPGTTVCASSTDHTTWRSFDEAKKHADSGWHDGAGFVFTEDDEYCGIDIDEDTPFARWVWEKLGHSYAERSISGKGAHIIVKARVPKGYKFDGIEIYSSRRFFVMTGDVINDAPIVDCQAEIDEIVAEIKAAKGKSTPRVDNNRSSHTDGVECVGLNNRPATRTDDEVKRLCEARHGDNFRNLWNGKPHLVPRYDMSQSGADVTLINYLVAMSGNHNQVERIFWQSALGQRRLNPQPGDKKKSLTYISDTIRNSFETFKSKLPELNPEIRATFERSLNDFNQSQGAQSSQGASQSDRKRTEWKRYNKDANPKAVPYLVKRIIPRVGVGTVAGPWGAFKSTIILELAFCVMTGEPFMGVHRIKRQGPVLFYGLESGDYVETQMQAIARHHGYSGDLPLYFVDSIPPLLSPNAEEELFASIKDAGIDDIAMIPIDTQGVAAGFTKDGQDNDTATNAQIMTTLKRLARRVDTVIIPVDHFGKNQELGTRGASAKEDHADFVLASLCDRAVGGALSNTRIALRKVRFGKSGS